MEEKAISVDSSLIKHIKYVGVDGSSARVTVQLKEKFQYRVEEDEGKMTLIISEMTDVGEFIPFTPTPTPEPVPTPSEKPKLTATPTITPTPDDTGVKTPDKTPKAGGSNELSIDYVINGDYNKVFLSIENYASYNAWRLSEPDRIVIDVTGAQADKDQKTVEINSGLIDSIRYAQFEQDVARVVVDIAGPLSTI